MEIKIKVHPEFERQFKRYARKYNSLIDDYDNLIKSLRNRPLQGSSLGNNLRKVRLGVDSKGGGKSGGMRVITYTVTKTADGTLLITLLYIYDKSEMASVSLKFLRWLLAQESSKSKGRIR